MTLYEAKYGVVNLLLLYHGPDDYEAMVYMDGKSQIHSAKSFTKIEDAFYWFHRDVLKTDISCSKCIKKINRQIAHARNKQANIKE